MAKAGSDAEGLASWEDAGADIFGAAGRVMAHSGFVEASRALAGGMLALAEDDPALDGVFKDAGRYFAAMSGFALHEGGGLTLPRLKAVCTTSGLLSAGRARAQLHYLEHLDYLSRAPGGGKAVVYAPTARFEAAWDRHFVAALAAARPIAPDIERLLGPGGAPARRTYGRLSGAGYLAAMQQEQRVPTFLKVFMHPHAGSHILWVLLTSDADPAFPPARAGPVSIKGLAARAGVARIQVARIFKEAAAEGLADVDAHGYVCFHPAAREELRLFYAIQLVQLLAAASVAAREHGLTPA